MSQYFRFINSDNSFGLIKDAHMYHTIEEEEKKENFKIEINELQGKIQIFRLFVRKMNSNFKDLYDKFVPTYYLLTGNYYWEFLYDHYEDKIIIKQIEYYNDEKWHEFILNEYKARHYYLELNKFF